MSITTKKGDDGTTALMFNRRVPKWHPNVEACGTVDELTSVLGLARATSKSKNLKEKIYVIQNDLITLMGELATLPEDMELYKSAGFKSISKEEVDRLEEWINELSNETTKMRGWAIPGDTKISAVLDLARTVCRRAERRVCAIQRDSKKINPMLIIYLNRLADLLWLFGRWIEHRPQKKSNKF